MGAASDDREDVDDDWADTESASTEDWDSAPDHPPVISAHPPDTPTAGVSDDWEEERP